MLLPSKMGRLTILSTEGNKCLCLCDCGTKKYILIRNLNRKTPTQSCGCLQKEKARAKGKHGLSRTRAYNTWSSMHARCYNKKHSSYYIYGKRGITVCEHWHKFENFLLDMGQPPYGRTLDRIDGTKGYNKENCRWATYAQQVETRLPRSSGRGDDGQSNKPELVSIKNGV